MKKLAALLTAVLTLAACSPSTSDKTDAVTISVERIAADSEPSQFSVENLATESQSGQIGDALKVTATVRAPGIPDLEKAVSAFNESNVKSFTENLGAGLSNSMYGEINISLGGCGASGNVFCVEAMAFKMVAGSNVENDSATWFVDSSAKTVLTSQELFTESGARAIISKISEQLKSKNLYVGDGSESKDPVALLTAAQILPTGDLVVRIPELTLAPHSEGEPTFKITGDIEALLSESGVAMRNSFMSGAAPIALAKPTDIPSGVPSEPVPVATLEPTPTASVTPTTPAEPTASAEPTTPAAPATPAAPPVTASPEPDPVDTEATPDPVVASGNVDCTQVKCVALTFDDGPGKYTPQILDTLKAKGARATFFVIGSSAASHKKTVAREIAEGHAVGNHTWSHPQMTRLSKADMISQLSRTNAAIEAAGAPKPVLVRPPYGAHNKTVDSVLKARGNVIVLWDIDTEDWKNKNASTTTARALQGVHSGAIILMHDIHPSTAKALPGIIDKLQAKGYHLVTIPELLGDTGPYVGKAVYSQKRAR